jgi:predicted permease
MRNLGRNLGFGLRALRRSPSFTSVSVLSLALGIGANTAIFSVIDALLLRDLPVKAPRELMLFGNGRASGIDDDFPNGETLLFSEPFFRGIRANNSVFTDVAAEESMMNAVHARFSSSADPERARVRVVSGNYFALLGVGAAAGRMLTGEDDRKHGGHPVAVMSHAFWERRFAADPEAIGKTFAFNGITYTIVGVADREFFGTVVGEVADFWIPLSMLHQVQPWFDNPYDASARSLRLIGRAKSQVTQPLASANVNVLFQQWLRELAGASPSVEHLEDMRKAHIVLTDGAKGVSDLRNSFSEPLKILMAVVGVVLLIACANVANLHLARAAGRTREISVRLALGASRGVLVAQLLTESALLGLIGGALGLLAGWWGSQLLITSVPQAFALVVGPNPRVLLFTFALALATGLLFGIAPALRMTRADIGPALKEGKGMARSQSRSLLGQALVAGQVALALFLMIGAGLFLRTLLRLNQTNLGFDKDQVTIFELDTGASALKPEIAHAIEERVRALPGIEATSFAMMRFQRGVWTAKVWPEGVERTAVNAKQLDGNRVGATYFQTMGMPMLAGRTFGAGDTPQSQHVAVVNETFARKIFPETPALGRHFSTEGFSDIEVIGVVKDAKYRSLRENPRAMWFLYTDQERDGFSNLMVRMSRESKGMIPEIRAAIHSQDATVAVSLVAPLANRVEESLGREKLLARLATFFGALALLLASIGLYGVLAYSVSRRTNEIGIRMALGARPGGVLRMVLGESLILVAVGVAVGVPSALACGRFVASQLYGVPPSDFWTITGAAAILTVVALTASFLPARRAALLDPLTALREE